MAKSISHLSSIATQETNTAGVTTPVLEIDPDNGTMLRFLNRVASGDDAGLPVIAKFKDAANNVLPTDTELIFRVVRPTDDEPMAVSVKADNIAAWNGLSISDQRNEENIDAVKVELKGAAINVRDKDTLRVEVNSSAQIDWSNSELYIPKGVEELPFEG